MDPYFSNLYCNETYLKKENNTNINRVGTMYILQTVFHVLFKDYVRTEHLLDLTI